jgi:hypothetical protein
LEACSRHAGTLQPAADASMPGAHASLPASGADVAAQQRQRQRRRFCSPRTGFFHAATAAVAARAGRAPLAAAVTHGGEGAGAGAAVWWVLGGEEMGKMFPEYSF